MGDSAHSTIAVVSAAVAKITRREQQACAAPQLNLLEHLSVDSLALLEIIETLEKELQVTIPDEDTGRVKTVGDLYVVVQRLTDQIGRP
ncbi:phosphopantetheine-binding protein [Streptosporangium canum]|uniref:phosphopantetheine-binding protein n=1 Tax=Streptosporangium canum TaxID=324952 RepID=UPI0033B64ED7